MAADVFEPLFTAYSARLRDGDVSIPSRVTRMPKVIEVMDPTSRTSLFGNVYLSLSFRAGETDFELVYLVVRKPSVLGMLAWRGTNGDVYFIGRVPRWRHRTCRSALIWRSRSSRPLCVR